MFELNTASFYGVTSGLHSLRELIKGGNLRGVQDDPTLLRHLRSEAAELEANLRVLGVEVTLIAAEKLNTALSNERGVVWEDIGDLLDQVHRRLLDELTLKKVLVLERDEAAYFAPSKPLFGEEFVERFRAEGEFELGEAAKCLAVARPTAAVFHLMRLLEVGIRAVARCLSIPDPLKPAERNWAVILKLIRESIDACWPTQADRMTGDGQTFDALYASLDAVKNPWRNSTMHVEKKYTEDEAEHVFVAVKGFMERLACRCDENGNPKV
jgi:hypothetical protein